jgi:threonine dehydrogenase-like Zn-dependent dehydrogenase
MRGRLAVLTDYGEPFVIEEYDVPDPEPGGLIVQIAQASICGSDLHMWRGDSALSSPIPKGGRAMGHEGSGRVWKLGAGVTHDSLGQPIAEGDRIVHSVIIGCHACHMCLRGQENLCLNKVTAPPASSAPHFVGTFADYYYVRPNQPFFRAPAELSDEILSPVNCAMGTVTQGLISAGVGEGDSIVIQGAGGLGLIGTAMAKDMGADRVIVVDKLANRLEVAKQFGADYVINVTELTAADERIDAVWEYTRGRGADVVLELVGHSALVPEGIAMLRPGGSYVDIGLFFAGQPFLFDPSTIVMSGKRIMGSAMYRPILLAKILDFLVRTKDRLPFDQLVSHHFALDDIDEAFQQSEWESSQTPVVRAVLVP